MPAAHVEELQKLHRLYQRGEFDIDTVQTKHRLIVEYQRKRAVGGNLGTVYQDNGGPTYDEMEPSVAELDEPDEAPVLAPLVAGRQGDTSGCSSVYHDINADGAAAAGSLSTFVRGGMSGEMVRGRPGDPGRASGPLVTTLQSDTKAVVRSTAGQGSSAGAKGVRNAGAAAYDGAPRLAFALEAPQRNTTNTENTSNNTKTYLLETLRGNAASKGS